MYSKRQSDIIQLIESANCKLGTINFFFFVQNRSFSRTICRGCPDIFNTNYRKFSVSSISVRKLLSFPIEPGEKVAVRYRDVYRTVKHAKIAQNRQNFSAVFFGDIEQLFYREVNISIPHSTFSAEKSQYSVSSST